MTFELECADETNDPGEDKPMSVDRARAELSSLTGEISRLKQRLADMAERSERLTHFIEVAEEYATTPEVKSTLRRNSSQTQTQTQLWADTAISILQDEGRRLHIRKLLERFEARGIHVGGENPVTNLSGALSRSDGLKGSRKLGWGLKGWPIDVGPPQEPFPSTDATEREREGDGADDEVESFEDSAT